MLSLLAVEAGVAGSLSPIQASLVVLPRQYVVEKGELAEGVP